MTHPRSRRGAALEALALAAVFFLSFALFYRLTLRPSSDISIHATWAAEGNFADLTSFLHHGAHPMWHVLVALVLRLGVPLAHAAALVTAACKTAEVWLIRRLMGRALPDRSPAALTGLALCVGTVSSLLTPYNPTVYLGVGTPNTWHSPTQLIAMVWMLICVPLTARCYDRFEAALPDPRANIPWREGALLGALLLLSLTAKPTFMQAFLPAACLFFLVQWVRHPQNSRFFLRVLACVVPAIAFMILQYMYYFGIIVPSQGDMVLEISLEKLGRVLLSTLLMQAFPLYVLVFFRKDGPRDTLFDLTMVMDAVGVAEYLLLGENGRRAADGNFGWGMMGAALMLWVVTAARFFAAGRGAREADGRVSARRVGGLVLFGWHLLSGVYYGIYLFLTDGVL